MSIIREHAKTVFEIQSKAILNLSNLLTDDFENSVNAILTHKGRVIVCGTGKSGIIGKKIAATLASTGTPAFSIHPTEALHGDLGMIKKDDIFLGISKSGETEEVLRLLPYMKENKIIVIAMTCNPQSTLARHSDFHLNVYVEKEVCPFQLAPTTSTTTALVMGDAIAVALMKERGFKVEDFARFHPGGSLGRRLLMCVEDAMTKDHLPIVRLHERIRDVIPVMTSSLNGISVVVDTKEKVVGVITDGDLRRALQRLDNILDIKAEEIMTHKPKTISGRMKLYEAEQMLTKQGINALLICDENERLTGIIAIHNILYS